MRKFLVQAHRARWLQAALLATSLITSQPLLAMTFTVDDMGHDTVDAAPGDGLCADAGGKCTLRAAIQEANAWPGADKIRVPAGTYTISIPNASAQNENQAATGDLDILDSVTISGVSDDPNAANPTIIDGGGIDRVFDVVGSGANVTIANLIVQGGTIGTQNTTPIGAGVKNVGNLTLTDVYVVNNNNTSAGGGGLANEQGNVNVNYSTFTRNGASSFGGVQLTFGSMTIKHSKIIANTSQGSGAGVGVIGGTMSISDTDISNNIGATTQGGNGGGITNNGTLTLLRSLVSGNTGAQGGGVANEGTGKMVMVNSTVEGNISQSGGGIFNQSNTGSVTAVIINSTISHNNANGSLPQHQGFGGGIFYPKGVTSITNTIIADNTGQEGLDCSDGTADTANTYVGGQLESLGHNLDTTGSCLTPDAALHQSNIVVKGTGDLPKTDPVFASSAPENNGGPTKTLALTTGTSGSPAIDWVPISSCTDDSGQPLTLDQRSFPRPAGSACDIGAVEETQSGATEADLAVHTTESPNPIDPNGTLVYNVAISDDGPSNAGSVVLTDTLPPNTVFVPGGSSGSCTASGTTVTCTVGAITKGNTSTVTIAATVPPSATGTLTNKTSVTDSATTDPNINNNSDQTDTPVNLSADLQASISATPNTAVLNQDNVTYTVTVSYPSSGGGTSTVPGVTLIDNVPANAILVSGSTKLDGSASGACTENPGAKSIVCKLGPSPDYTMSPGQSHTVAFTVKPTVAGTLHNTATVNFDGTDLAPTNNKASVDTSVEVHADVSLTITTNPADNVQVNNDLVYILNVINNGPSPSSDVQVQAQLPTNATFDFVNASRGNSTCSNSSGVLSCDLKAMGDGDQATVTIFVTPTVVGPLQFSATASIPSTETDPDTSNNTAASTITVAKASSPTPASADLSIGLSGSPNPVTAGAALTYTLKVTNNTITGQTSDSAGSVIAVLALPASVNVTSPSSGCAKDSAANVVRCDLGQIAVGASAEATVGVTPSQAGIVTANASVNFAGVDPNKANNTATTSTTVTAPPPPSSSGKGGAAGPFTLWALLMLYGMALARRRT